MAQVCQWQIQNCSTCDCGHNCRVVRVEYYYYFMRPTQPRLLWQWQWGKFLTCNRLWGPGGRPHQLTPTNQSCSPCFGTRCRFNAGGRKKNACKPMSKLVLVTAYACDYHSQVQWHHSIRVIPSLILCMKHNVFTHLRTLIVHHRKKFCTFNFRNL